MERNMDAKTDERAGKCPVIDPSALIAPTAVICGEVTIGTCTSVGFGAVLTAESGPIVVGRECVIMENAVIRGTRRHRVTIGDHVLIGPGASLSGCAIRECAFLATGLPDEMRDRVRSARRLEKDDILRWQKILYRRGWGAGMWPKRLRP